MKKPCSVCGDYKDDWYLDEYIIQIIQPNQEIFFYKHYDVCNLCIHNLIEKINKHFIP